MELGSSLHSCYSLVLHCVSAPIKIHFDNFQLLHFLAFAVPVLGTVV